MKSNPQIIRLDITNPRANVGQIVHIVGGDAGSRLVEAIIYDNGEARSDLKNVSAQLYIEPLSGKRPIFIDIVIVDGISTFTIPQSAGVTAGRMNAAVRIVSDDATEILSSMPFIIECAEPVYSESAVIGTDEADTLKAMVNDARKSADTAASLAKTASDASSDAKKYATESVNSAGIAHDYAESAAASAESAAACVDAATQSAKAAAEQVLKNKVDKSQVVSHLSANEQIPNGAAAVELCHETILQKGVSSAEPQGLTDQAKAIARENIGAASVDDVDELKSDTYCLTQYETVETKVEVHVTDWQNGSYASQTGAVVKNNSQVACAVLIDISSYNAKKMEYTQIAHTSSTGEQPAWYTILMDENENVLYKYRCPLGNDYTLMTIDVPTGTHYALFTFRMSEQSEFVCNLITEEKIGVKQPRIDLIEKKKSDSNPIRFTVKTLTFDGIEKDTNCILSLSKNYSYYGNPSPIILMGHGTNSYVSSTSWNRDLEEWYSYINFLNENGYSVFDVDNTEALHTGENVLDCGCPELLKSYREAFEWIKANYNVQDRCIVWGQSQGSFTAVNFSHMYPSLVKCLLIAGPRVPMEEEWGLYKNKFASKFGANSDEPYDVNLFRPFSIYDRIENEKIITPLPPSLWLIGGNDNIWLSQMNDVINALKNSGYYVEANVYDGQDHHTTTYAMTEAERVDILRFLKLFG